VKAAKSVIFLRGIVAPILFAGRFQIGMARATSTSVVLKFVNKLAKYLGEGTSRRAAKGNLRCFSFCG
jgi:hypothetical protein